MFFKVERLRYPPLKSPLKQSLKFKGDDFKKIKKLRYE
jgi:hypothetical protein